MSAHLATVAVPSALRARDREVREIQTEASKRHIARMVGGDRCPALRTREVALRPRVSLASLDQLPQSRGDAHGRNRIFVSGRDWLARRIETEARPTRTPTTPPAISAGGRVLGFLESSVRAMVDPPVRPDLPAPVELPRPPSGPPPKLPPPRMSIFSRLSLLQKVLLITVGGLLGLVAFAKVGQRWESCCRTTPTSPPPALYCAALVHLHHTIGQARLGELTPEEMTSQLDDVEGDLQRAALIMQSGDETPGPASVVSLAQAVGHLKVASSTGVEFDIALDAVVRLLNVVPSC